MNGMSKKKNILLVICSFTFLLCVFALLFSVGKPLSAAGEDLFEEENGISMDAALPESAGTDDPRKGVLLTAAASGTKFTFSDTFAGRFVLDFRAFSEETYNSPINSGNSYVNNYADFEEMMITFTDKNDETNRFSIVIAAGSAENYVTPNVSVAYGDAKAGIYYDENVQNSVNNWTTWGGRSQTKAKNALGYYTYLPGSSLCNKAYYGYQFAAPESTVLAFDPATMQVSAYAYDAERVWGERLILDLDAGLNDHLETPVLKGFAQYGVEISLNAVKEGKTAKVLLYSLNGQSLDGAEFSDDAAPNLYADLKGVAEKGARFDLFPAYIYDVIDGVSAFSGSIVADIDGYEQTVLSENGMPYLVPDRSGNLTVRFKAGDAAGNRAELVKQVAVKDGIFEIGCEIKTLPSGTYGTGERFYLNEIAFDEEYRNVLSPLVTLSDGPGKAVGGIDEIPFTEPVEYVFETAGEYVLTISAAGFADTLVYEYTVTDAEVAFVFSEEFAENYAQGDRLTLPAVTAGKDGKEVAAALTVTAPSGESFSVKDFLYLTEYG